MSNASVALARLSGAASQMLDTLLIAPVRFTATVLHGPSLLAPVPGSKPAGPIIPTFPPVAGFIIVAPVVAGFIIVAVARARTA
jgi:hypothetical protein